MDKVEIIEKLKKKANVSYEEAKIALESSEWDILDAVLYLEEEGKIPKPQSSIYFSNEHKENNEIIEIKTKKKRRKKESLFQSFFEVICELIDKCNNIFFIIKRFDRELTRLPLTVIILLVIFAFGIILPFMVIGIFCGLEFSLEGENMEDSKINYVFKSLSDYVKKMKENSKKGNGK